MNQADESIPSHHSCETSQVRSHNQAEEYADALEADYEFEAECVRARFGFLLRHLKQIPCRSILEVGCGLELFMDAAIHSGLDFRQWVVIEPASRLAQKVRDRAETESRLHVIEGYCEDPAICEATKGQGPFDVVLLSGVLQDVDDPEELLRLSLASAAPGARVLVTTPNALSFHRLLAVEMGLMPDPHSLSPRNLRLRQNVVFDHVTLRQLLEEGGLRNLQFEGYMFKPFTHIQMARVLELLPPDASQGLDRLGQKFPQYAAEIAYIGVKG
jgi:2-polyprenyl-3-methyl-5-hydroxy-6-metoxy-1,4-benzoquinol methylase